MDSVGEGSEEIEKVVRQQQLTEALTATEEGRRGYWFSHKFDHEFSK